MGLDPGVFGRFDLAALVQPHLKFLFVCYALQCELFGTNASVSLHSDSFRSGGRQGRGCWPVTTHLTRIGSAF